MGVVYLSLDLSVCGATDEDEDEEEDEEDFWVSVSVTGIVAVWKGEGWCVVLLVELFLKGFSRGKCVVVVAAVEAEVVVMALFEPERRAFLPSTAVIFVVAVVVVTAAALAAALAVAVAVAVTVVASIPLDLSCPFIADPDSCPSNVLLL